jgi:hypothetical protein
MPTSKATQMPLQLLPILNGLATRVIAYAITSAYAALTKQTLVSTRGMHRHDLRSRIKDMPFIYKNLEGEVFNDFVDPDLSALDIDSLTPAPGRSGVDDRIRNRKRVLVLGNAGIGKTTFLRYEILLHLRGRFRRERYFTSEHLLPFYVPLKAIDNSKPYPILRYLLENNLYLRMNGLRRLIGLAEKRELFLFLDGYDEIAVGKNVASYIAAELQYFFQSKSLSDATTLDDNYRRFYKSTQQCRIWISSRREFFALNPIVLEDAPALDATYVSQQQGKVKQAVAIHLSGVGQNRHQLADKIFDKYRRRKQLYADLLSAEYFLQGIDCAVDEDFINLSYNPLFLTVMAYLYAEAVVDEEKPDVSFVQAVPSLVLTCISLLLIDIDKDKARGIPVAQKAALLRRRGKYVDEKTQFLYFFSIRLLYEERNLFDLQYLREKAIAFFTTDYKGPNRDVILRELRNPERVGSDIAIDLIYCGVFVLVDRSANGVPTYDFPHRRFREVLASKYFDDLSDRASMIDRCIERPELTETLLVIFSVSKFKEEILRAILGRVSGSTNPRFGNVLLQCVQRDSQYDPTVALETFFLRAMREDTVFTLPYQLLDHLTDAQGLTTNIRTELYGAIVNGRSNSTTLGCYLLQRFNCEALFAILTGIATTRFTSVNLAFICASFLWNIERDYCIEHIASIVENASLEFAMYLAISQDSLVSSSEESQEFCAAALNRLPLSRQTTYLATICAFNDKLAVRLMERKFLSTDLTRFVALFYGRQDQRIDQYVLTFEAIDLFLQFPVNEFLGERLGSFTSHYDAQLAIRKVLDENVGRVLAERDIHELITKAIDQQFGQLVADRRIRELIQEPLDRLVGEVLTASQINRLDMELRQAQSRIGLATKGLDKQEMDDLLYITEEEIDALMRQPLRQYIGDLLTKDLIAQLIRKPLERRMGRKFAGDDFSEMIAKSFVDGVDKGGSRGRVSAGAREVFKEDTRRNLRESDIDSLIFSLGKRKLPKVLSINDVTRLAGKAFTERVGRPLARKEIEGLVTVVPEYTELLSNCRLSAAMWEDAADMRRRVTVSMPSFPDVFHD